MTDDSYRHLLNDVVRELAHMTRDAVAAKADDFSGGHAMGLYEAISLIEQQAIAFQIDPSTIGFRDFKADDLLALRK